MAEDHQRDKIHKTIHKTDITDQIDKTNSTETITLTIPLKLTNQTILEIAHIQTTGIATITSIDQEILQITAID